LKQKNYKILLVEDDAVDKLAFERMIAQNDLPYRLQVVASTQQAKNQLETEQFDIVVLDYLLEDGTAFDVLKHIKDLPVIVYTGEGDQETAVKAMKSGATNYLIKDLDQDYLKMLPVAIEKAIEKHTTEVKLQEMSKLHHAILNNSIDSFIVTDLSGHIIFGNKSALKLSKCLKNELLSCNIGELLVGEDFANYFIDAAQDGRTIQDINTYLRPKSGLDIPVSVSITPLDGDDKILFCVHDLRPSDKVKIDLEHFREFAADHIIISLFKVTNVGPKAVMTEPLSFKGTEDESKEILIKMGIYYSTALGHGESGQTTRGLFGPLPVPDNPDYHSLIYSFNIADSAADPRYNGINYAFLTLTMPKTLERLFTNRESISAEINKYLEEQTSIYDIELEALKELKKAILHVEVS